MCIPPIVARQWLGKLVPAAPNTCNNRTVVGRVCLCISVLLLNNNSVRMFRRLRRIVGGVVFYAILVVSKQSRRLVLPNIFFVKNTPRATKQEEQPVTWNTHAHRGNHTFKIYNRSHDERCTAVSSTIILNT
jgi:hypothetical protein